MDSGSIAKQTWDKIFLCNILKQNISITVDSIHFESQMQFGKEDEVSSNWMKEAQKGYIRVAALIIINKRPAHGYEIMKEIKEKTRGFWRPTAGGMYPILRDLENSKYIVGEWGTQKNRKLKTYRITNSGKQILQSVIIKQNKITRNISVLFKDFARDVLNVATDVHAPAMPSFFSPFLEEDEVDLEKLKKQKSQIRRQIRVMQQRLRVLEKRIGVEKESKNKHQE
jgi:DNA-binding PadR family transcriptional regulator